MKVDWLIVGAGFTGATLAERVASSLGKTVMLVDKRGHVGGNAYDSYNEHGILVHRYGPHIFHTNSKKVWSYLSNFTPWRTYFHRVHAVIDGNSVPLPFNLNTLQKLFPKKQAEMLEGKLVEEYGFGANVPMLRMLEAQSRELRRLGEYVYDKVFCGYTVKQWDLKPEELDPSVTGRVPIRISRDDRYFQDTFQGIPMHGYTELFRKMLSHPNIHVSVNTEYSGLRDVSYDRMIFTGPIDEFFNFKHGALPYRSVAFSFETLDQPQIQSVGTVNYPNEFEYTRVTEQKHLTGQTSCRSTLVYEYPQVHTPKVNEPYYPIPRRQSREIYEAYAAEAQRMRNTVLFAGRLADYRYYNMDQAVGRALSLFEREVVGS
jgi:UDP-galactopyranose mutase